MTGAPLAMTPAAAERMIELVTALEWALEQIPKDQLRGDLLPKLSACQHILAKAKGGRRDPPMPNPDYFYYGSAM